MGGEQFEVRITYPRRFFEPAPDAVRPRVLDWQMDSHGTHVASHYRITRYEQDGQPRWSLDGTGQHPWTSDDVEYLKDVAEHHAGRLFRRRRWHPTSMYNDHEPPLWLSGRGL
ncbi:hypothetical protein [Mycolicibacterium sp. 120270]|uniref:hypothetical protein n=1 Tax=Mycolicibacterium sp. 120270 TaxID=3090600 RepID=UPI00299F4370|nr:hypothetical protein [Mycolicibacterium sp. 120270]MDX1884731.1 hypothetical protein [Mycolicibacterium sp. 120270]